MFKDGCASPGRVHINDFEGCASFDWFKESSGRLIYMDRTSGKVFRSKTLKHNIPNIHLESKLTKYFSNLFPSKPWRIRLWESSDNKVYFMPSYIRLYDLEHGSNIVFAWRNHLIISPTIGEYTCEACIGIRLISAERNHGILRSEILTRESEYISGESKILDPNIEFIGDFQMILQNINDKNNPLSYFRWSENSGLIHKIFLPLPGDHKDHKKLLTKYLEVKN